MTFESEQVAAVLAWAAFLAATGFILALTFFA
jgi:hypothetical protein